VIVDGNAGAIVPGDPIMANASGQGVKAGTDKDFAIGVALQGSTALADTIEVELGPFDVAA